jgi:hypothetical protein
MSYVCDNCGGLVWLEDDPRKVKKLTTRGSEGPTAFVLRVGGKNIHRCAIPTAQTPEDATP